MAQSGHCQPAICIAAAILSRFAFDSFRSSQGAEVYTRSAAANRGAPKSELWVGSGKSDGGRENRQAAAAACSELNLGNELSYDAASEMACDCFNEFDEIDVVISLIRDCADHNKRYIALVTNLSDRRTFHFYTQCFW